MTIDTKNVNLNVWLVDLTHTQQTVAADVIPNAIGCIASYTEKVLGLERPIRLFKYPERLDEALEREGFPDVIGFSHYVWNAALTMAFVEAVKRRSPRTVVVVGGPNYPYSSEEREAFLRKYPGIDFYILKEGEAAFANLLARLAEEGGDVEAVKRSGLLSVHSIDDTGTAHLSSEIERITDLTEIPSPYLDGRLDPFFDGVLVPIVQTNRGCPFTCTFCVEGVRYYHKIYRSSREKVDAELEYIGAKMEEVRAKGGRNDLFIADSNFAMYKEDIETCRKLAHTRERYGWPQYINVATGKNQKERVLSASKLIDGALRLSGSVQSLDQQVLKNIKRGNISSDQLMELALNAAEVGANSYSEIILGLPGDTLKSHIDTIHTVIDAGFNSLVLYQLMLLPGTELASAESKQKWGMTLRYRVLPRCYGRYRILGEDVPVAEIEEICAGNEALSFEDYVFARRLHLIINIFYNDGFFGTLLKIFRRLGISLFRWIELIHQGEMPGRLGEVFASFEAATRSELWEGLDELRDFTRREGVIEKYLNEELGNNLIYVYKSRAISQCVPDLLTVARRTTRRLLEETGHADAELLQLVEESVVYHGARADGIFERRYETEPLTFTYDIPRLDEELQIGGLAEYRLDEPRRISFAMDEEQREMLEKYLDMFGATPVGIGRIITKIYVRKLFRKPYPADPRSAS